MKVTQIPALLIFSVIILLSSACNKNASVDEVKTIFFTDAQLQNYVLVENQLNKQLTSRVKAAINKESVKEYFTAKSKTDQATAVKQFREHADLTGSNVLDIEKRKENARVYIQLYIKYVKEYQVPKKVFSAWMREALMENLKK